MYDSTPKIRIVLADDHQLVRAGLRTLLEEEPDFEVLGEAPDGRTTMQLVEQTRPDVLIVDLMMPGMTGLEVTQLSQERSPSTRVVVLSIHADEGYVVEALRRGALAYVLKGATVADLFQAVREVVAGRRFLSPPLSPQTIDAYCDGAGTADLDPCETLTNREHEVLRLAAEGLTNQEIAQQLAISPRTAETHRARVMHKLGLHAQTDLVRYAIKRGLLSLND